MAAGAGLRVAAALALLAAADTAPCADLAARTQQIDSLCFSQRMTATGPTPGAPLADCSPGCASVLVPTWADCALDPATTTRLSGIAALCGAASAAGDAASGDEWQRGSCKTSGGDDRCLNGAACVVQWGNHDLNLVTQDTMPPGACPANMLATRSETLNNICCAFPTSPRPGGASYCSGGAPTACDKKCAAVLLPFWSDCAATLAEASNGLAVTKVMQTTVSMCAALAANVGPAHHHCVCAEGWTGETCSDAVKRRTTFGGG